MYIIAIKFKMQLLKCFTGLEHEKQHAIYAPTNPQIKTFKSSDQFV